MNPTEPTEPTEPAEPTATRDRLHTELALLEAAVRVGFDRIDARLDHLQQQIGRLVSREAFHAGMQALHHQVDQLHAAVVDADLRAVAGDRELHAIHGQIEARLAAQVHAGASGGGTGRGDRAARAGRERA